jgi:hypothetical protein
MYDKCEYCGGRNLWTADGLTTCHDCIHTQGGIEEIERVARERCAVCGGLNPGDSSHVRCM